MTLGARLKQLRTDTGFSQEMVAERVGVSRQAVTKWESGRATPTAENLAALKEEAVHRARNHRIPHCYYLRETNEDGRGQEIPVEGVPGDIILLTFSCRDEYGLEYEFYIEGWEIGEDDVENYEADLLWYIPQLTWPE